MEDSGQNIWVQYPLFTCLCESVCVSLCAISCSVTAFLVLLFLSVSHTLGPWGEAIFHLQLKRTGRSCLATVLLVQARDGHLGFGRRADGTCQSRWLFLPVPNGSLRLSPSPSDQLFSCSEDRWGWR